MSGMIFKFFKDVHVKWKPLGELVNIKHGKDWKRLKSGDIPVYGTSGIIGYVDAYVYKKPTVLIPRKGSITNTFYLECPFWNADTIYYTVIDETQIIPKFLYYYLKTIDLEKLDNSPAMPSLTKEILNKIEIPILSLSMQNKIIKIMDIFMNSIEETKTGSITETALREKQFRYYRNKLFTFKKTEVEWKTIQDVFEIKLGYTPSKSKTSYWENGTIPWFRMKDLRLNGNILSDAIQKVHPSGVKGKIFPANSIIMAMRATVGEHALITVDYVSSTGFVNFITKNEFRERLNMKFVYYYFFILDKKAKENVNIAKFPTVQMNKMKKWEFPIPSLSEQERIISILEKFYSLTQSTIEGLPKEINLRKQQYEYYRDQLLSFPKP